MGGTGGIGSTGAGTTGTGTGTGATGVDVKSSMLSWEFSMEVGNEHPSEVGDDQCGVVEY